MQQQPKIKVGVIGTGNISGVHFNSLAKSQVAELVGVCDVAPGRAESVAKQRGGRPYTDYEEMLDKETPGLVLLLTPQSVRVEPIRACAERGIPMFIEKPPARDMAAARQAIAAIRQHNLMTSVGFVFRYYNIVAKARELLKGRTIHIVRMRYYAPMMLQYEKFPPFYFQNEVSGGMIVDQALHMIDLARYVVGDEVSEVHGVGSNLFQPKTKQITTDENVTLNLRFERGTVGSHVHSWGYANWTQEAEFVSPQARLILDLGGQKLTGVVDGVTVEYKPEENGYNAELEAMLAAVRSGDRALIRSTYEDAVKTLGICLAANRSLETRNVEKVEQA